MGEPIVETNSLHHQGILELAPGLAPNAYAPDGLIEGIELEDYPYGIAVQWHPEELTKTEHHPKLFQSFVEAVKNDKSGTNGK